jgi:hypothetical protein
MDEVLQGF